MANTIKIKRGLSSNISKTTLAEGELAVTTDTNELYVGTTVGNVKLNSSNVDDLISIGENEPTSDATQLWVDEDAIGSMGTEVIDSLEGNEANKAPSVRAVKEKLNNKPIFPFMIDYPSSETTYLAEYGMTFEDWVNSTYNTKGFYFNSYDGLACPGAYQQVYAKYYASGYPALADVKKTHIIVPGSRLQNEICCFEKGSQVLISLDGTTKNIEDIKENDQIVIYNEDSKQFELSKVVNTMRNPTVTNQAQVILDNNISVIMNAYHPLLTTKGYHSITQYNGLPALTENDVLITTNGLIKIKEIIETTIEPTIMYNLKVESNYHNFIVNSIVVHNASGCPIK